MIIKVKVIDKLKYRKLDDVLDYILKKLKYFLEGIKEEDEELYKKVVDALRIF